MKSRPIIKKILTLDFLMVVLSAAALVLLLLISFVFLVEAQSLYYWWALIFWTVLILRLHLRSKTTLIISISLFCIAAFLNIIGLMIISEITMRLTFIALSVGVIQSVIEYKSSK